MVAREVNWSSLPSYSYAEAARYLRMPATTVRYWAKGGSVSRPTGESHFDQVLVDAPSSRLTFANLTELMIVRALRTNYNISLSAIRHAQEYASTALGKPLYLFELHAYGKDIFIRDLSQVIAASRYGQVALKGFFDQLLTRVAFDDRQHPEFIFPEVPGASIPKPVQISPVVSFGAPTITGTGIQTAFITYRLDAGEEAEDIASGYGLAQSQILDAYKFHMVA